MTRHEIVAVALAGAVAAAGPALAEGADGLVPAGREPATQTDNPPPRRQLGESEMSAYSAGEAAAVNVQATQSLTATSSGNSIGGDLLSGDVSFADGALDNFSGVGNVVINTGANSNLQGSILVTVVGGPEL